jgi:uracil-DNA glycosylase
MTYDFNFAAIDKSWLPLVETALKEVDPAYLQQLQQNTTWLPGKQAIFNAFSLPLPEVKYILFGESPYPRPQSANGYAFWDNAVKELWSEAGLSKTVNRATSLRNFIKMLLAAGNYLPLAEISQHTISQLPKQGLVQTGADLFGNLLSHGFLLLNASLVLSNQPVRYDAKAWYPFMRSILKQVYQSHPHIQLVLFGSIASVIEQFLTDSPFAVFRCEHPYNISFIANSAVQAFFAPFELLKARQG